MIKLCVNIDHVATVRQSRRTFEPCPLMASKEAVLGGADGITLHIREDRRHMQDADLFGLRAAVTVPINLELAATQEMIALALKTRPDMAMIVPEGRDEITTEGGLDVVSDVPKLRKIVQTITEIGVPVSAFIDADVTQIKAAHECGFSVCEIHTGGYAEAVIYHDFSLDHEDVREEVERIQSAVTQILELGMQCNAGHGLTHHNVGLIASIRGIKELHIGHSIVSRSIFVGMKNSVEEMKAQIQKSAQ